MRRFVTLQPRCSDWWVGGNTLVWAPVHVGLVKGVLHPAARLRRLVRSAAGPQALALHLRQRAFHMLGACPLAGGQAGSQAGW